MGMPSAWRPVEIRDNRQVKSSAAKPRLIAIALAVSALGSLHPVAAQTQSQSPVPTREELDRGGVRGTDVPSGGPKLSVDGGIERAPCALSDPRFADVRMTISSAEFGNLQGVSADMLRPAYQDYVGREVPVATVCDIRDRAATILREAGYIAAVQVPPQRIDKGGVVRFEVLMAKLTAVHIRGEAGNSERLIAAHLEALKNQPIFNIREAERHLLLLQDLPGYEVRLTLRPAGTVPGEVVGEVRIVRHQLRVDANIQNMGSTQVGRWGALLRAQFNDLTGLGDSTVVSLFNTLQSDEQTVVQVGHSFALGSDGLRFSGDLTLGWARPDVLNGAIRSKTKIGSIDLSYPVIRRQAASLIATGGIEVVNQDARFGLSPLLRDRLRVLFARAAFEAVNPQSLAGIGGYTAGAPKWRLGGQLEARQGISGLGASDPCPTALGCLLSRGRGADITAFVVRGQAVGEYRPVPKLALIVKPRFQYTSSPVLSYEEFSAGNYSVGRGYDPGSILGDSGIGVAAEIGYGSAYPKGPDAFAFQPYTFFDSAWTWNEDVGTLGDPQKLYSAGVGVRGAWGNKLRFDLTAAVPLKRLATQTRRNDVRVLLSVSTQLLPWSY